MFSFSIVSFLISLGNYTFQWIFINETPFSAKRGCNSKVLVPFYFLCVNAKDFLWPIEKNQTVMGEYSQKGVIDHIYTM